GLQPLTGRTHRRVAGLIAKNIALYSAHLPLDLHPEVGNNAVLARQLGVSPRGEFGEEYGVPIGRWGEVDVPRDALERQLAALMGKAPRLMAFGPERVRRVGAVPGEAGAVLAQVDVFYAGHYATETVGVKALAEHLQGRFHLPWTFLDHPTGL